MKRLIIAVVVVSGLGMIGMQVLEACGAKFLVSSRAARYQRLQAAKHPASILLYWPDDPADPVEEDEANANYEATKAAVERVGHTLEAMTDLESFRAAAGTGEYDIFLMDVADARKLRGDLERLAPQTVILPVMEFATRPRLAEAKREFGHVVSTPTTARRLLSVIADARGD